MKRVCVSIYVCVSVFTNEKWLVLFTRFDFGYFPLTFISVLGNLDSMLCGP